MPPDRQCQIGATKFFVARARNVAHELVASMSGVRALVPQKICSAEGLMHVKSVMVKCLPLEWWGRQLGYQLRYLRHHLTVTQNYEVLRQQPSYYIMVRRQ
ncbi:hypothetical protein TNCV_4426911 [Trichonephila clavipes]|nr:hypothetical protein TNCV_4426911 [Trichonephila clavipes]